MKPCVVLLQRGLNTGGGDSSACWAITELLLFTTPCSSVPPPIVPFGSRGLPGRRRFIRRLINSSEVRPPRGEPSRSHGHRMTPITLSTLQCSSETRPDPGDHRKPLHLSYFLTPRGKLRKQGSDWGGRGLREFGFLLLRFKNPNQTC